MSRTLPKNAELAAQFDLLADLMEVQGGDSFRVGAYRKAAARIRETSSSVAQLALDGRAKELQGIGKTIEEKIVQAVEDGEVHALTKRKSEVPPEVATFIRLPGLGPKTARRLWQELGITTVDALRAAAEAHELRAVSGIGPRLEERILIELAKPAATEEPYRALLGRALPKLREVAADVAAHPAAVQVSIAGSARRFRETVRDLDLIATATDAPALLDAFCSFPWVVEVAAKGDTKATVVSQDGFRYDLRVVPPECYGNLLQHFTGSAAHNVALREAAVRRGLSVSEYGIAEVESGEVHAFATEEEVYAFLGYAWIPPELRENGGELDAARNGGLPKLVELGDLRGDLHTHTTWSDGKDTLEAMVGRAVEKGYAYYAVCDHSHRLRDGRLAEQAEAIAALNAQVPLTILRGIEANIRVTGELDVSDDELATLDWVVASVHASFDKSATERVLAAMENPHVDCIGHVTGRKIGKRAASEVDVERVIEKALETGTFLEINSQPDRLDLTDVHARAAREAGLKLVIDSDGHQLLALDYVELGVGQARRAWLTKDDVVNTRTLAQLRKLPEARMTFRDDLAAASDFVASYLEGVGDRPVVPPTEPGEVRAAIPASPPERGEPFADVLRDVETLIAPALTHWNHPRFFAYFSITGSEPGILGELMTAAFNVNAMSWSTSPAATELEQVVLDWLAQLLGLPRGWHGHIEDTASTSTLAGLAAARELRPGGVVCASEQAHFSVEKAARILGMEFRAMPVDDEFRMLPDFALDDAAAVVATVGTTSSTSVDPVAALADRCAEAGVWLHVDAAYAGSAAVCPELRWCLDGCDRADSIVVNPHKWLFTPVDCSAFWTRRPEVVRAAFAAHGDYLAPSDGAIDIRDYGPALGRRFRALKLWTVLRCYGREGLQALIREHVRLAALFEGWVLAEPGWELAAPRHFSTVCFRHESADNEAVASRATATGELFVATTKLRGQSVIRLAIGNSATQEADVRRAWEVLRECAR